MTERIEAPEVLQLRSEIRKLNSRYKSITEEFCEAEENYRRVALVKRQIFDDLHEKRRQLSLLDR